MSTESSIVERGNSAGVSEENAEMGRNSAQDAADGQQAPGHGSDSPRINKFVLFAAVPSWIVSMIVHIIALLILALITLPIQPDPVDTELTLRETVPVDVSDEMPEFDLQNPDVTDVQAELSEIPEIVTPNTEIIAEESIVTDASDLDAVATRQEISPLALDSAIETDLLVDNGGTFGAGLEGRGHASRKRLLREGGGSAESERAVQMALEWFLRHQLPDGSWSFRHALGRCPCPDHGTHAEAVNAATAMALLPFLGAGYTHTEGKYREPIRRGLYFLLTRQKANGSFAEPKGNLYSHGLCAITLSEAYGMTKDPDLLRPAQAALNYIAYAQDPIGGGWRYAAKQPGDTSVVGWQLMALKSGKMAYLDVDPRVLIGASKYLDSVQVDEGSGYGYTAPGDKLSTTSIGLLCRMYMGWDRKNAALVRGIERLSKSGPSKADMYYNYYATQVMRHYEGEHWKKWNKKMRDFLVATQVQDGHAAGSWQMGKNHSSKAGGRHYNTALATMVLEVYYRHLPIYRQQATDEDFKL